jgi:hypothetical protein
MPALIKVLTKQYREKVAVFIHLRRQLAIPFIIVKLIQMKQKGNLKLKITVSE